MENLKANIDVCESLYTLDQMPKAITTNRKKHAPRISFRYTSERVLRCMLCKSARVSQTMPIYSDRIMHIARLGTAEIVPAHTPIHRARIYIYFERFAALDVCRCKNRRIIAQASWIYFYSRFIRNLCDQL